MGKNFSFHFLGIPIFFRVENETAVKIIAEYLKMRIYACTKTGKEMINRGDGPELFVVFDGETMCSKTKPRVHKMPPGINWIRGLIHNMTDIFQKSQIPLDPPPILVEFDNNLIKELERINIQLHIFEKVFGSKWTGHETYGINFVKKNIYNTR